jgi:hypothetical protein
MQISELMANMTDLLARQEETKELFEKAKKREVFLINAKYRDVLCDCEATSATFNRVIREFLLKCESELKKSWSEECSEEILEAYEASYAEMNRINNEFHSRWGSMRVISGKLAL